MGSASALLLRDVDRVRFVPDGANADAASFDFRAWDRTSGVVANKLDVSNAGGSTAYSSAGDTASILVTPVNDAPRLGDTIVAPVTGDPANAPGETVANLFAGRFSDVDSGARLSGIAVVGNAASSDGRWEYSSDGGSSWSSVGTVGDDATALAQRQGKPPKENW